MPGRRLFVILLAAASAGCADVAPSQRAPSPTGASRPGQVTSDESPGPAGSAQATAAVSGTEPPYRIVLGRDEIPQVPGTIVFGSLPGPLSDALLEPYPTWPEGGLTIDAGIAFGAFWGEPLGAPRARVTLYRIEHGTLERVWSVTKPVDENATGYLDELVPFERPGAYRLEVTRGTTLLAWGVAFMGPPCTENCSGG